MKLSIALLLVVVLHVATGALTGNIALNKPAYQSSTSAGAGGAAERAVDGNDNPSWWGYSCTHTSNSAGEWWAVDLGQEFEVVNVEITNRGDCCWDRLGNIKIGLSNTEPDSAVTPPSVSYEECANISAALGAGETREISCAGRGRYLVIQKIDPEALTLCEVKVFAEKPNIALHKPAYQSSTSAGAGGPAERAVDGNDNPSWWGYSCTHTSNSAGEWWAVDLENEFDVTAVEITNRVDCCSDRLSNIKIGLTNTAPQNSVQVADIYEQCAEIGEALGAGETREIPCAGRGRYLVIQKIDPAALTLCEVKVFA